MSVADDLARYAPMVKLLVGQLEDGEEELTLAERHFLELWFVGARGLVEKTLSMAETSDAKAHLQQLLGTTDACIKTFGNEDTS